MSDGEVLLYKSIPKNRFVMRERSVSYIETREDCSTFKSDCSRGASRIGLAEDCGDTMACAEFG